ncbi:MAG: amidohydrolase [Actinobacteria bacterium]|nr:amidohydrolase [Actinomycetota bacterium]
MRTPVETAIVNARVRTMDPANPHATAVAVGHGAILAVGTDAEIRELAGSAEVIDLRGAALVPGLTDSHAHPLLGALHVDGADLLDARRWDEVVAAIRKEAEGKGPDEWVIGWGLPYDALEGRAAHRDLIEEAAGGRPTYLKFVDFHTVLASQQALDIAGIRGPMTFAEHAEVVCDAAGVPTGELREWSAIMLVDEAVPAPTPAEQLEICHRQMREFAKVGLTGIHGMDGTLETLDVLRELEASKRLITRLTMPFWFMPDMPDEEWEAHIPHRDARGRRWRGGVAKFLIDGVIDTGTAWLVEPDALGEGLEPAWPEPERYRRAVQRFAGAGFQCATHACGDMAVRYALDAYRSAGAAPGVRHRVEHIDLLHPDDLPRFAAEGVVASMQTQHMMWLDPGRTCTWTTRMGDERCDRAYPTRSLVESGAVVALGSDWPVARFDPRIGMASAQLRHAPGNGKEPFDDQALSGLEALHGYTVAPAYTISEQHRLGRIKVGYCADLTAFAEDPVECPAEDLVDLPVVLTMVDGEIVHRA